MSRGVGTVALLVAAVMPWSFDQAQSQELPLGYSLTCHFTSGPRAGETQQFSGAEGIAPFRVGSPCTDGLGSSGIGVVDTRAVDSGAAGSTSYSATGSADVTRLDRHWHHHAYRVDYRVRTSTSAASRTTRSIAKARVAAPHHRPTESTSTPVATTRPTPETSTSTTTAATTTTDTTVTTNTPATVGTGTSAAPMSTAPRVANQATRVPVVPGVGSFAKPPAMQVGDWYTISFVVARNPSALSNETDLPLGKPHPVFVSPVMSVRLLEDRNFASKPMTAELKSLGPDLSGVWEWNVSPLRDGAHDLTAEVAVMSPSPSGYSTLESYTRHVSIRVSVGSWEAFLADLRNVATAGDLVNAVLASWYGVLATLSLLIGAGFGVVWAWRKGLKRWHSRN